MFFSGKAGYHMNIGNKLKELRVQKGLTQEELADRAELSKGFISQLERDLTSPSIATLVDILQVLGTDLNEFFSEKTEEQIVFSSSDYFEKTDERNGSSPMPRKTLWSPSGSPWNREVPPIRTILMKERNSVIY